MALMTGAAEFAARYYERHRATPPDYFPSMFYPHRRLRYGLIPNLDYYGWFKINSLGFRGREFAASKPPGVFRIVCLGASTTFDVGTVGPDLPWPEVLERELRVRIVRPTVEVLNLGIPGATSLDSLIDLQMRALPFQPDIVVVYQAHNDFIYSIPPAHRTSTGLFAQEDRPRGSIERWLTMHSLLYAKGAGRVTDLLGRLTSVFSRGRSSAPAIPLDERQRVLDDGVSGFASNLRSLAAIAQANGVQLVVPEVVVPLSGASDGSCRVCAALSRAYGDLPRWQIASTFAKYNQVLKQLGTQRGVHYISTDGFVPAADRFYTDSVHFSSQGSARMGERLAGALLPLVQSAQRTE